jgi:hypothetical protein
LLLRGISTKYSVEQAIYYFSIDLALTITLARGLAAATSRGVAILDLGNISNTAVTKQGYILVVLNISR